MAPTTNNKRRKTNQEEKKWIKWIKSEAKKTILQDFEDRILSPTTPVEVAWKVYKERPEFKDVPYSQFKPRYKDHCKAFQRKQERNVIEEMLYQHDRDLHPCNDPRDSLGRLIFHRHAAKDLLRQDIKDELYPLLTPSELWQFRSEYQCFELEVFTQRIYQEIRRNKYINWRELKRAEKEAEREERRNNRDYTFS